MCDFNALDDASRQQQHERLVAAANALGGKNFFLKLLEAIRAAKPHPLISGTCQFSYSHGTVTWNKVIFLDKLNLLLQERTQEGKRGNLLPETEAKHYKKVLNLVRTLHPITLTVKPKNSHDGAGFSLQPFDVIDDSTTRLDLLFDAIFFCSVESVKKMLNYEIQRSSPEKNSGE